MASVDIVNSALTKLGVEKIATLADNSRQAVLANEQYDKIRKSLLRQHPWNFAMVRATLTNNTNSPAWGFEFEFDLPATCLRFHSTEYADQKYKVEGRKLLCDYAELNVLYISDVTDTDEMAEDFKELLALALAVDLSYSLIQSASLTNTLLGQYDRMLRDVRSFDGQESADDNWLNDEFLNSRL